MGPIKLGKTIRRFPLATALLSARLSPRRTSISCRHYRGFQPMHVNEEFSRKTMFGKRIAHGGITTSLIAPVLGTILPGLGTVALETSCRYRAPVFPGDTVTATATVLEKDEKRNRVRMELKWVNQEGTVVADGTAVVMPPKEEYKQMFGLEE